MTHVRNVNFIVGMAAIVAALSAVAPAASAADLLKLAAQRGAWESAAPELGRQVQPCELIEIGRAHV